jgi:Ca2+-binding EF-hand superfamily protein
MKFAIAALLASTSAIRIGTQGKGCVSKGFAAEGFAALDTDHSGSLSYDEIGTGLEELAKALDHKITAEEWAWLKATGEKIDSKTPGSVDEKEFFLFANAVFKHFDLCELAREAEKEMKHARKTCVSKDMAEAGFEHLDTNHNGSLSYQEIEAGLKELAAALHHTLTADEWAWIKATGTKIDKKNPGKVDKKEFYRFANAVFRHFDLCELAREEEAEHSLATVEDAPCVSMKQSDGVFHMVDTNGNGQISKKELTVAVTAYLKENHIHPTAAQVKGFTKAATADAGADHQLNPVEFNSLANQVCAYIES